MSKVGTYNAFDGKLDLNIYIVINPDDTAALQPIWSNQ